MNYLIVCPQFADSNLGYYPFPVGIAYVNASLKTVRDQVFQLNLNYKADLFKALEDKIRTHGIDCLIIGGTSLLYNQIRDILKFSKKLKPDLVTIVGGGLITAAPETAMQGLEAADIGIIGEGEYTIKELADAIELGNDLNSVKGIIYRTSGNQLLMTEKREEIDDLDALPFPDYDGFEYEKVINNSYRTEDEAIINVGSSLYGAAVICTSRSCPFNCTFCFHTCGNRYRKRSLDNIFLEIDQLVEKYNIRYLNILDELFGSDSNRVIEFCKRIEKYNIVWRAGTRVDNATEALYETMRKAGCCLLGLGIESANNSILESMNKKITIEQIENAFDQAKKAGIGITGYLLLGDKNESTETFKDTIEFYRKTGSNYISWTRIIVLPGSALYHYAVQNGFIQNELDYWSKDFPYLNVTKMTDQEYEQCTNVMEEITAKRLYLPKQLILQSFDADQRVFKLKLRCTNCDVSYMVKTSDVFGNSALSYNCPNCGQFHDVSVYELIKERFDQVLNRRLNHDKIDIYGVGHDVRKLLQLSCAAQHPNLIVIDRDERKQQNGVFGKSVNPPSLLSDERIETVINGGSMQVHIESIEAMIHNTYPHVRAVNKFNDFLLEIVAECLASMQNDD